MDFTPQQSTVILFDKKTDNQLKFNINNCISNRCDFNDRSTTVKHALNDRSTKIQRLFNETHTTV